MAPPGGKSEQFLEALAGSEASPPPYEAVPAEEAESEAMEKLMEEMARLRDGAVGLSAEERRERAAKAAMTMAEMFGDDDDGEDDEVDAH